MNCGRDTITLKLIKIMDNEYTPSQSELQILIEHARVNKILLGFLRKLGIGNELRRKEEAGYRRFQSSLEYLLTYLKTTNYALYKFRKPIEHVSVDIDLLIDSRDIWRAVRILKSKGFEIVVVEPYTVTLRHGGIIVDLYTHPAFAWSIYMDGEKLLREYVEDIVIGGRYIRALTREAEVLVSLTHALYKEHIYLLSDFYILRRWFNKRVVDMASDLDVVDELSYFLSINERILDGCIDTPYKIPYPYLIRSYLHLFKHSELYRGTFVNTLRYLLSRRGGRILYWKLTRRAY